MGCRTCSGKLINCLTLTYSQYRNVGYIDWCWYIILINKNITWKIKMHQSLQSSYNTYNKNVCFILVLACFERLTERQINDCVKQWTHNKLFQSALLKTRNDKYDLLSGCSLYIFTHLKWRCPSCPDLSDSKATCYMLGITRSRWRGSRHSSHNTGRLQCLDFLHFLLRLSSSLPLNRASRESYLTPSPQPLPHPLR